MFHFVSESGWSPLESLYVSQVLVVLLGSQRFPDVVTALQLVRWGKGLGWAMIVLGSKTKF